MNKRGYEFSFAWLFAIIIGAVVIFLAVYAATSFVGTSRFQIDTETAKEIGVLLNPIETNIEQAKVSRITVPDATRIFAECDAESGNFGIQQISASVKSGINQPWLPDPGATSSFRNKYIFSSSPYIEADKNFYILSKPFSYPFKIADFIIIWSDKQPYCFVNSPSEIEKEIEQLSPEGLISVPSISGCPAIGKIVCFPGPESSNPSCDIVITPAQGGGRVTHLETREENSYIESIDSNDKNAMLYAAIFSSPEQYNCQIHRLMKRLSEEANLLREKSQFLQQRGCGGAGPIQADLLRTSQLASAISNSRELSNVAFINQIKELYDKNDRLNCDLF